MNLDGDLHRVTNLATIIQSVDTSPDVSLHHVANLATFMQSVDES